MKRYIGFSRLRVLLRTERTTTRRDLLLQVGMWNVGTLCGDDVVMTLDQNLHASNSQHVNMHAHMPVQMLMFIS